MSVFSNRLENLRIQKGWTKTYTGKKLGLALTTYANYEYGEREPDFDMLKQIATLFDTSTDYLTGKTNDPSSTPKSKSDDTALTWSDLGVPMPYGGNVPDELKETYSDLAKGYFKRHPELLDNDK